MGDRIHETPIEQISAEGSVSYLHHDQQNSTRLLTNASGAAVGTASYDAYGNPAGETGSVRSPLGVYASTDGEAVARVRALLVNHGSFRDYEISPVRDVRGELWRGPFYRSWDEIDWQAVPGRARLTELERAVLGSLLNAGEPVWTIARDLPSETGVPADRASIEAALSDLEKQGLVYSTLEQSGESGRETEMVRWWAVTDLGWDLVGMIKSPRYR